MTKINASASTRFLFIFGLIAVVFLVITNSNTASAALSLEKLTPDTSTSTIITNPEAGMTATIEPQTLSEVGFFKFITYVSQDHVGDFFTLPSGKTPQSDLYLVTTLSRTDEPLAINKPIAISLSSQGHQHQQLMFFNWLTLAFEPLVISTSTSSQVSFQIPTGQKALTFGWFGTAEQTGTASWYVHPRYPTELMAASVDYPFGTKLRVINMANNKEVIVTVKDYGPNKAVHPDRVIDLSKTAFAAIASTGAGVIKVRVLPVTTTTSVATGL